MIISILFFAGLILLLVAFIRMLIAAFQKELVHGLLMLFFGWIYFIIFSIMHWEEAKKPFFTALVGFALLITPIILAVTLAPQQTPPGRPSAVTCKALFPGFKQKLAQIMAAKITSESSRGEKTQSMSSDAHSESLFAPVPVQIDDSQPNIRASKQKKFLMAFISKKLFSSGATGKSTPKNDWEKAHAMLRVGGIMQTSDQLLAAVNQEIVKVNDTITVDLRGRLFHFKVRRIDFRHKTVQFAPVRPM